MRSLTRFVDVVAKPQTYRNILYLLLGLPLGTLWFTLVVTAFSLGLSLLVVALAGIPLLIGGWYGVRVAANVERRVAAGLLEVDIPAISMAGPSGNLWQRLKKLSSDRDRWRELGFLAIRFPVGIATFTAAVTLLAMPVAIAWAPFQLWLDDDRTFGDWTLSSELENLASTYPWSWLLVPVGLLLVLVALHVLNALADACGRWTTAALGSVDSAGEADAEAQPAGAHQPTSWVTGTALLRMHWITFAATMTILLLIDVAGGGDLWFYWPLFTWGPVLAIHAAFVNRPEQVAQQRGGTLLYAHVVIFTGVMAMLVLIDIAAGGGLWFYWPLVTWGAVVALHVALSGGRVPLPGSA